jgi:hypothetical protein
MSRYAKITDGCNVTDIALAESGYNYYLYTRPGGSGVIMREATSEDEYRFYLFGGADTQSERLSNIQTIWADRANKVYVSPGECKAL